MEQVSALHCGFRESPDILICSPPAPGISRKAARQNKLAVLAVGLPEAEPVSSCMMLHGFTPWAFAVLAWPGAAETPRRTAATSWVNEGRVASPSYG